MEIHPIRQARLDFERNCIIIALKEAKGRVSKAAELIGVDRTHLYRMLRAHEIDRKKIVEEDLSPDYLAIEHLEACTFRTLAASARMSVAEVTASGPFDLLPPMADEVVGSMLEKLRKFVVAEVIEDEIGTLHFSFRIHLAEPRRIREAIKRAYDAGRDHARSS